MRPAVSRSTEVPSRGPTSGGTAHSSDTFGSNEGAATSSSAQRSPLKEHKKAVGIDRIMTDDILRPIGEIRRRGGGSGRGRDSSSSSMAWSTSTAAPHPLPQTGQSENLFNRRIQSSQSSRSARGAAPQGHADGGFLGAPTGGLMSQLLSPLTLSLVSIQGSGREPTPLTLQAHSHPAGAQGSRPGTSPGAARGGSGGGGSESASGFNWAMLDSVDIPAAHSKHVLRMTLRSLIEHSASSGPKNTSLSCGNGTTAPGYNRDTLYSELMSAYQWAIADYAKTSKKRFQDGLLPTSTNLPGRPTPTPPQPPIPLPTAAVRSGRSSMNMVDAQMIDWEVPILKGSRMSSSYSRAPPGAGNGVAGGSEFLFQELDEMAKEHHLLNTMLDDLRRHHDLVQRELDAALEAQHRSDSQLAEAKDRIRELEATVASLQQQVASHQSAPTTPSARNTISQASPRKPPTRQAV